MEPNESRERLVSAKNVHTRVNGADVPLPEVGIDDWARVLEIAGSVHHHGQGEFRILPAAKCLAGGCLWQVEDERRDL